MGQKRSLKDQFVAAWNSLLRRLQLPEARSATQTVTSAVADTTLAATLNAIPDLMFEIDEEGRHWDCRALRKELLIAPPETLLGTTVNEVMPPEQAALVMAALQEAINTGYSHGTQLQLSTPIGERWFEVSMARKEQSSPDSPRFIVLSRDITERKLQQIQAERLAYIDPLTELPNRNWLQQQLQQAYEKSQSSGMYGALLFLDLDKFKTLNDSKGHHIGDQLLQRMAQRLRTSVRKGDLVARWGGDEFIILIQNLGATPEQATDIVSTISTQIIEHLNRPYELDGDTFNCPASIGINLFNGQENDIVSIIQLADLAMYNAKQHSPGQYRFSDSGLTPSISREDSQVNLS